MSKLGSISHFLSRVSCDSLVLQGIRYERGAGVLNLVLLLSVAHTGHWKFNMAPHGKELSEDLKKIIVALHKDGLGYKEIAKTLKLSCSTVAKTIQVPLRTGLAMINQRSWVHVLSIISRGWVLKIDVWVLPALLKRLKEGGGGWISLTVLRPYAAHCTILHGCCPRRKPLLKMMHKKARKQFAEDKQTKDMDYWNHALWSDETNINLFCSDGVKRVWWQQVRSTKTSVSCLQSSMVVGVSWSGAAWVLPALGSYSSLREPWIPTCTVTYWSRAWSPPFGDWAAWQYSNMTTTTALLKKLRVKVMDWPSMSPDLTPIEHLWDILKWKVNESKVSNIHQLRDVIMEEWKRMPVATSLKRWWTPCPRCVPCSVCPLLLQFLVRLPCCTCYFVFADSVLWITICQCFLPVALFLDHCLGQQ